MWIILVIIFCIWIIPKLLRWWIMRKLRKNAGSMFEQFARAAGAAGPQSQATPDQKQTSRKGGWQRAQHDKKITPDEGEYVDYDEVTVTIDETTTDGSTTTHTHIEASETRIEDVEWEDI